MPDASHGSCDFFISYNKADLAWAEWVGSVLEQAGYTVLLDVWDFKGNFVAHMHWAESKAERTVALLSDSYFNSDFTLGEWTARYARDPAMREDRLIPVVVGPVSQASLLDSIIHADLFVCGHDEKRARKALLERVARAVDRIGAASPSCCRSSQCLEPRRCSSSPAVPTQKHSPRRTWPRLKRWLGSSATCRSPWRRRRHSCPSGAR